VAVVDPAATATLAGTVAEFVPLLDNVTVRCAAVPAAGSFRVTVPVEFADPPNTLVGLSVNEAIAGGGVTVRTAVADPPFRLAVIVVVCVVVTPRLVMVKFAVVDPAGTATVAGTVAADVLLLVSVTVLCATVPTAGAFNVTVPIELVIPPRTLVGFGVTRATTGSFTVRVKACVAFTPTELPAVNIRL
jgi:hypothetical protein